ncbi:hypothetical protein Tco_1068085, partial [Tanacetum coccineum]
MLEIEKRLGNYLLVQKAYRGKCEPGSLNGVDQEVGYDVDLVLIQVMKGRSAQMRVTVSLTAGQTPRLSSGVRYESGEEMDLNAFIRTVDLSRGPRRMLAAGGYSDAKPLVACTTSALSVSTVGKRVALELSVTVDSGVAALPTLPFDYSAVLRLHLSEDWLSEMVNQFLRLTIAMLYCRGQEDASIGGYSDAELIVPVTTGVAAETGSSRAKRPKKKRVVHESEDTPAASHPPKRLRADYGNTSGSVIKGKSPGVLNRLLRASQLTVEQGVAALPTIHFITSSVIASPLEKGGGHTDSATASALRTVGPSERFMVLSDSSHYSSAKSTDAEVDSLITFVAPDKNVPTPSIFAISSSSEKTDRTLCLFAGRSGSDFVAGSIRAEGGVDTSLQEVYIPEWTMTKGFELNDGLSCTNMIDHFTPPAFFKTVREMEHEQLFAEFNVFAARNLSLSSEVRMRAEYNILEKRKWRSLA